MAGKKKAKQIEEKAEVKINKIEEKAEVKIEKAEVKIEKKFQKRRRTLHFVVVKISWKFRNVWTTL